MKGHGAMGLRDGLRTCEQLAAESAWRKDVLAQLRPGKLVTSWSVYSGAAYVAPLEVRLDGRVLDVVGVRSLLDAGLERVETPSQVVSVAGTYSYDPHDPSADARWGDGFTRWGDGVTRWGVYPRLYVHLEDGSDPALTAVSAHLGIFIATRAVVHPTLGPDLFGGQGYFTEWE